ncbi:MAG: hypothetical protein HFH72_03040 [Lachnospiraceae bacterium]|nr:hypothetical protein [Lachnospiraceae bacterium]
MYKILIWGTGSRAEKYIKLHAEILDYIKIQAFIDGGKEEWKDKYFTMPDGTLKEKIRPNQIGEYKYDYIVVLSTSYKEIVSVAMSFGVPLDSILDGIAFYKLWRKTGYYYFKEKYGSYTCKEKEQSIALKESEYVWVSWLQGWEAAPILVQKCVESIKKWTSGKKFVFLTMKNVGEYIEIPDYVMEKFSDGIIRPAFFSDILRLLLLEKYGGLWVDATVFCMDDFSYLYSGSNFFAFRVTDEEVIASSWFLYAAKGHVLVKETLRLVLRYCREMEQMEHYYIFHYFFRMAAECYEEEWDKVPAIEGSGCYLLFENMNAPYTEEKYQEIARAMPVQKLNYRQYLEIQKEDTFYQYVVAERLGQDVIGQR